jgi:hypothetical protein
MPDIVKTGEFKLNFNEFNENFVEFITFCLTIKFKLNIIFKGEEGSYG